MLWLGDNIYADTEDMAEMRAIYDQLAENPRFQALAASTETMAVWDDHDMGSEQRQRDVAAPRRREGRVPPVLGRRAGRSALGPARRVLGANVRDRRIGPSRSSCSTTVQPDPWDYAGEDPGRRILGDEQWAWLRERLAEPATIRIIGSGVQVVQDYDIDREWEGWGDSPLERDRLFKLIRELRIPGVIFVSGDMHFAELTRHPDDAAALGYPTYDLTPSGLDQVETAAVGEWSIRTASASFEQLPEARAGRDRLGAADPRSTSRSTRARASSGPCRPAVGAQPDPQA